MKSLRSVLSAVLATFWAVILFGGCGESPTGSRNSGDLRMPPEETSASTAGSATTTVVVNCPEQIFVGEERMCSAIVIVDGVLSVRTVSWSSSNGNVVAVSGGTGTINGKKQGSASISACVTYPSSACGSDLVRVVAQVARIAISPYPVSVNPDFFVLVTAVAYDVNGNEIPNKPAVWSIDNNSTASLDQTAGGTVGVRGQALGSTTVRATIDGVSASAPVNVTEPSLTAYIQGPDDIWFPGTYTWEAMPFGGSGNYTYRWEITYDRYPGMWSSFGDEKTVSTRVEDNYMGSFSVRVTVMSGAKQVATELWVINHMLPPEW
jgi:hypothetical protein